MQLKEDFKILEFIKGFQNDFLVHDKKALRGYTGDFILQIRPSGTALLKVWKNPTITKLEKLSWDEAREKGLWDKKKALIDKKKNWKEMFEVWILQKTIKGENLRFFFGSKGKVREIKTKKELTEIWKKYNDGKLSA